MLTETVSPGVKVFMSQLRSFSDGFEVGALDSLDAICGEKDNPKMGDIVPRNVATRLGEFAGRLTVGVTANFYFVPRVDRHNR